MACPGFLTARPGQGTPLHRPQSAVTLGRGRGSRLDLACRRLLFANRRPLAPGGSKGRASLHTHRRPLTPLSVGAETRGRHPAWPCLSVRGAQAHPLLADGCLEAEQREWPGRARADGRLRHRSAVPGLCVRAPGGHSQRWGSAVRGQGGAWGQGPCKGPGVNGSPRSKGRAAGGMESIQE